MNPMDPMTTGKALIPANDADTLRPASTDAMQADDVRPPHDLDHSAGAEGIDGSIAPTAAIDGSTPGITNGLPDGALTDLNTSPVHADGVAGTSGPGATGEPGTVRDFYKGRNLPPLPMTNDQLPSVLEKLGQPPFPKNKFPFLGFLASIYDHIAERAHLRQNGDKAE